MVLLISETGQSNTDLPGEHREGGGQHIPTVGVQNRGCLCFFVFNLGFGQYHP